MRNDNEGRPDFGNAKTRDILQLVNIEFNF